MKLEQAIKSNVFRDNKHKASLNILYTAWWLKTFLATELKKYGLTHEQFNVLRILKGQHPEKMCVRDIASRMIEKSSNVPRIADRLELKKLVKRSTSHQDKRETSISLTDAGINILEHANLSMEKAVDKIITISENDANKLNLMLEAYRGD